MENNKIPKILIQKIAFCLIFVLLNTAIISIGQSGETGSDLQANDNQIANTESVSSEGDKVTILALETDETINSIQMNAQGNLVDDTQLVEYVAQAANAVQMTELSEQEKLTTDKDALSIRYNGTDSAISLPQTGSSYESAITWSSNNTAVARIIGSEAVITRPFASAQDITVVLSATITRNDLAATSSFDILVKKQDAFVNTAIQTEDIFVNINGTTNLGKGQLISVVVRAKGTGEESLNDIIYLNQTKSDENGAFHFAFYMKASDGGKLPYGIYSVHVGTQNLIASHHDEYDYSQAWLIAKLLTKINQARYMELGDVLSDRDNIELLQLEQSTYYNTYKNISNKEDIYRAIVTAAAKNPFQNVNDFITVFNAAVKDYLASSQKPSDGGGSSGKTVTKIVKENTPVIAAPTPSPETKIDFTDLEDVSWAKESITQLVQKGIVEGVGNKLFLPNEYVTREQFIKMLVKVFQFTDGTATCSFSDVKQEEWYYTYIASAEKLGIVKGMDDGTFGIGQNITRQEMTVLAYRAVKKAGIVLKSNNAAITFEDEQNISDYAKDAVIVMQQAGTINGVGESQFAPNANASRAQSAKIIYSLLQLKSK